MSQQDQHASELNHAEEIHCVTFPTVGETTKVFQPSKQALNFPAPSITTQGAAVLRSPSLVATVGRDQLHLILALQPFIQGITIVRSIANHARGQGGDVALHERLFDQSGFMRRSACNPHGDRKTSAVADCHDLAPFAAERWTNVIAPFFAPTKEASMKVSSSPSAPRARRSSHSAHRIPSNTPSRSHCWKRRWQVWYGPYRGGKSCQGAPVRRIHSTPSSTWRALRQGRPRPSGRRFWFHSTKGLMSSHCMSVRSAMPFICINFTREASIYSRETFTR